MGMCGESMCAETSAQRTAHLSFAPVLSCLRVTSGALTTLSFWVVFSHMFTGTQLQQRPFSEAESDKIDIRNGTSSYECKLT